MTGSLEILESFRPISLAEMDSVKLLDRMDVKYIFHRDRLADILESLSQEFQVLEIEGKRCSQYETMYFDTPDHRMYVQHHNGKTNRHKIRFRKYLDSGITYFEIKFKNNKGRTVKDRVKIKEHRCVIQGEAEFLLHKKTKYHADMLIEAIQVNYRRITLVSTALNERITIDLDLKYKFRGKECDYPALIIAEVKQNRTARSPFKSLMQSKSILPLSLSKYCFGIANLNPDVKINNFKPKLLNVKKLCNNNS